MRSTPLSISIALCTYNGERFLRSQLESFAQQTLLPTELIACDDGSGDSTVSILEDFQRVAPFPVRIVINPVTLRSTRNFDQAIHGCSGEFIALSDQDDAWLPNKLEILTGMLDVSPEADGIFTDAVLIDADGKRTGRTLWQTHGFGAEEQRSFLRSPVSALLQRDIATGATMVFRSRLLETFDRIPPSWVHDSWLTWMMALHGKILLAEQGLTLYRIHDHQQLGVGQRRRLDRIRSVRATERAHYHRAAGRFDDLRNSLLARPDASRFSHVIEKLRIKAQFLRDRANLPRSVAPRVVAILSKARIYRTYARGFNSMRKDLFL